MSLYTIMLWIPMLCAMLTSLSMTGDTLKAHQRRQTNKNYQISPKPCIVDKIEGTCMFVWECIKSEGEHLGMCIDSFMFGSCCAHNTKSNTIFGAEQSTTPSQIPRNRTTLPASLSHKHQQNLNKHTSLSLRQNATVLYYEKDTTTGFLTGTYGTGSKYTARPYGGYTSVSTTIKPRNPSSGHSTQMYSSRPVSTNYSTQKVHSSVLNVNKPIHSETLATAQSTYALSTSSNSVWQVTTQPTFITKPRPNKPTILDKPTKKPTTILFPIKPSTHNAHPTQKPYVVTTSTKPTTEKYNSRPAYQQSMYPHQMRPESAAVPKPTKTEIATSVGQPQQNLTPTLNHDISPTSEALMPTSTWSSTSANKGAKCGVSPMGPKPEKRIVGGKEAKFGRWPWQVSVRRTSFFGFSSTHRCGGAVLNENWIATAGHCVDDLLTSQIRIRVGEYDFSKPEEKYPFVERRVARKVIHPKYNFFTYEYDLALVLLDKPLVFADHISPICLPASDDLLIGENATVTGWGRLSEGGTLPSVLQEVQVPIVSNDRCKNMFLRAGRHEYIPEIFLCAGHEKGGQDSCQGDSGGPLQVKGKDGRFFLAGIISWGIGCAEANLPGVCTRISKFVPWILENVT